MSDENVVLVEKRQAEGIAIVTINRPKALNALNNEVVNGLRDAYAGLEKDENDRVIIMTGGAGKAFVAGTDISMMENTTQDECRSGLRLFHNVFLEIENIEKPVIAAINGYAFGGGCELSLVCDIRIAAEGAKFAFPESSLGIIPGSGGTQRLTRLIGKSKAKYLMFSAARIDAQTALSYGLVDRVVPREELLQTCIDMAKEFVKQPPLSLAFAKRAANIAEDADIHTGISYETEAFVVTFGSEEKKKRMAAFVAGKKG